MTGCRALLLVLVVGAIGIFPRAESKAQSGGAYAMRWNNIGGGGQTFATGGSYAVGSTLGQPDAGRLAGGAYVVNGGFWSAGSPSTTDAPEDEPLPGAFAMRGPTPNPFRGTTTVAFDLPTPLPVRVAIHGIDGRAVRRLVEGRLDAGRHRAIWDGRDEGGRAVASGIYFVRLTAGSFESSHRVVRFQ
jgi:hypothetical protein